VGTALISYKYGSHSEVLIVTVDLELSFGILDLTDDGTTALTDLTRPMTCTCVRFCHIDGSHFSIN